jgi:hypothetical protein
MNVCCTYPCRRTAAGCLLCDPGHLYQLPPTPVFHPPGCICPPTSEKTCEAPLCPRKGIRISGSSSLGGTSRDPGGAA